MPEIKIKRPTSRTIIKGKQPIVKPRNFVREIVNARLRLRKEVGFLESWLADAQKEEKEMNWRVVSEDSWRSHYNDLKIIFDHFKEHMAKLKKHVDMVEGGDNNV